MPNQLVLARSAEGTCVVLKPPVLALVEVCVKS